MSLLTSIRFQAILLIAILVVVPVAIAGVVGILYYRDVIKHNIWDNNLAEARAISALTSNYVDLAQTYIKSLADRPLVVKAVNERDRQFLSFNMEYIVNQSDQIDSAFITDRSGTILSAYPDSQIAGQSYFDRPYVSYVLNTSMPVVSKAMKNDITGKPVVYVAVPVMDDDSIIGALVGTIDLMKYNEVLAEMEVQRNQFAYLVNQSGNVMIHSNRTYMDNMTDFSSLPAVSGVIRGNEGVIEQYFPFENDQRLVAYSPVPKRGWGVIVATPLSVAYKPIDESSLAFLIFLAGLLILSLLIAIFVGNYLTDPILRINRATTEIPDGATREFERYLPVHRKDEIGNLARAFVSMAGIIRSDRDRVVSARDQAEAARSHAEIEQERAEEEKNRAELYVDIMGHDINNLNQTALMNLELLELDENLTDEQKATIEDALTAVRGSASVIESVRTIQRATEEKIILEPVDINDLIGQCIKESPRPKDRDVTINYRPQSGLMVSGSTLLKAVFCNLISNAVKHSTKDITIDITVKPVDKPGKPFYDVIIEDNGPGIPDELKSRLFARFQRGATKTKGKGLGLFIVRTLVERFGGDVKVEDRVPGDYGRGSRFVVSLPGEVKNG